MDDLESAHGLNFFATRERSWSYLQREHPAQVSAIIGAIKVIDRCLDEYQGHAGVDTYAQMCGLSLLKGKNLAMGSFGLVLDGLAQESGALLRPMLEYIEMLTYLRLFPDQANDAARNSLPTAGARAEAIGGHYKGLREYLNSHASHSSYSNSSLAHLITPSNSFRKFQEFFPNVLDVNFRDLAVILHLMLFEGVLSLAPLGSPNLQEIQAAAHSTKKAAIDAFALDEVYRVISQPNTAQG